MAKRTVALYNGQYIGIETIYTVINGKQINIPEKLKDLREKSRKDELFCPCGCGSNLVLVAGDKNLREQHYRVKNENPNCNMPTEGIISVNSKIVLKCWLDDKINASDIETRFPIYALDNTKRKYEFSFVSRNTKLAISYWYTRADITDEKLEILKNNSAGIKVYDIVDIGNCGNDGQYPEALMKIQERQGYCLLLSVGEVDYTKASISAVFYEKDLDGLWQEIQFSSGMLIDYSFNDNNELFIEDTSLEQLLENARAEYQISQSNEKKRREEALKKLKEERERREQERKRRQEEAEKFSAEMEEKRKRDYEEQLAEKRRIEDEFKRSLSDKLSQQKEPVYDSDHNRWIKCEYCGKIAKDSEFDSYGGADHVNLGTCKECSANNPAVKQKLNEMLNKSINAYNSNICPECGGMLRARQGQYGNFMGCSNYPNCRFTRKIR